MKQVTIVIPTRNRYEKLLRTIESIPYLENTNIEIFFDGDVEGYNRLCESELNMNSLKGTMLGINYSTKHIGSVACRNAVLQLKLFLSEKSATDDGVLYATDDVIFQTGSIEAAFEAFNHRFPDDDGVIGFMQVPGSFHKTGVALVGRSFLQRFPRKQLFHPGYFHFACQEIFDLAEKYGKFGQCEEAVIEHKSPGQFKAEMDRTHKDARICRFEDIELMNKRQKAGLIWGDDNGKG